MTEATKKCPMCAELVPADAIFCPYCATRFGEEAPSAAPVFTPAPAPAAATVPVAPIPAMPRKASHTGLWIAGGAVALILVGISAILLWTQRQSLPLIAALLASPTSTSLPPTQTATTTPTRTLRPSPTATPIPAWVTGIADPILQAISGATPDYQNEFTQDTSWDSVGGKVESVDGVLKITVEEPGAAGVWTSPGLNTQNFVALVSTDLSGLHGEDTAEIQWSKYYLLELKHDGRWYLSSWQNNNRLGLGAGEVQIDDIRHVVVKLISYGDHFYLYINDQPQVSVTYAGERSGTVISLRGWSGGSTTAIARFELIYVWNLNHFQNLP